MLGALSDADRETWTTYLDAGRRAPNIKAAYFLEGESNDKFFWPEAVSATLNAVPGSVKNHVWGPNLNHHQVAAGAVMVQQHMAYYLKGTGQPFAHVAVSAIEPQEDGSKRVLMNVDAPSGVSIDKAELYYSESAPSWETRTWTSLTATPMEPNRYAVTLSAELAAKQLDFYGFVTDNRTITTSTAMYDSASVVGPSAGGGSGAGGAGGVGGAESAGSASGGTTFGGAAGTAGMLSNNGGAPAPGGAGLGGAIAGAGSASSGNAPNPTQADNGCSCRVVPMHGEAGGLWAMAALIALSYRRRKAWHAGCTSLPRDARFRRAPDDIRR